MKPDRGTAYVEGQFEYGVWDVKYKTERPGLIVYTIDFNPERAAKVAATVCLIGLAVASGGASIPSSAPALIYIGG